MRRVSIILLSFTFIAGISSCSKFLEKSSQDLIQPVTVAHYKELLQGEAYFKDFYKNGWFIDLMTDDIAAVDLVYPTTAINAKAELTKLVYQWAQDIEAPTTSFTDKFFQTIYKNILAANTCLESVDGLEGTDQEKKVLKGQALFTRAYGYFVLANLYAKAYNEASPDDLCVPLMAETTPSLKGFNRATIKQVWDLISNDITQSVDLLATDNVSRTYFEVNYKAALILASRIFLYKQDYDKVITYGEKYLLLNPALRNISAVTISPSSGGANTPKSFLFPADNPEIAFSFSRFTGAPSEGGYAYYSREFTGISPVSYGVSSNVPSALINIYGTNDRRKSFWFVPPTGAPGVILQYAVYTPMKTSYYDGARMTQNMRGGEVYLNLAEAYARKSTPDNSKAVERLNTLRAARIGSYVNLTTGGFANQQALVTFIWEERRRELCFEEFHRWWDLRRTGQPALQHDYLGKVYKLEVKDPAYVLNFPKGEIEFNPALEQNPRPVRNPQ